MNVLFIGDVVGPEASAWLAGRLPELRQQHDDLAIVNAENCRIGGPPPDDLSGMTLADVEGLFGGGADVITSGNHSWDGPDAPTVLANPRVLRPLNVPTDWAGKGWLTLDVAGEPVTVVNLADGQAIPEATSALAAWNTIPTNGTVIIDMHGGSDTKQGLAHLLDGQVAAVLGTHTHEPTHRLHLLPRGTALVVEVGMTGPSGGCGGFDPAIVMAAFRGDPNLDDIPLGVATGPMALGAVLLRIEDGKTVDITRVQ